MEENAHHNLFYVEEVLGIKGDGCGRNWNVLIQSTAVADIGPHSKCYRFGLEDTVTLWNVPEFLRPILYCFFVHVATLALSSWMVACCSRSCRLCPGPWLWLGLWLCTWACTSRSSSKETSESDGLLVYESAEPCKHVMNQSRGFLQLSANTHQQFKHVWNVQ